LRIFSEITYIRTVGNSTMLKIYTLPNHTITIGVCSLETQLSSLLYGCGASFGQKWSMPWMCRSLFYNTLVSMVRQAFSPGNYISKALFVMLRKLCPYSTKSGDICRSSFYLSACSNNLQSSGKYAMVVCKEFNASN
jgi:hypothetical protein